ncbi:MAG: 4Fe-4S binding protein [Bacteroidales bacterium]
MKALFKSKNIRLLSTVLAVLLALPLPWNGFTGLYTWFSSFIMMNSVFVLRSFVLLNFIAVVILVLSFVRRRFFCLFLCPVGFGCDLISKYGTGRTLSHRIMPDISSYLAIISLASAIAGIPLLILLDPMAIFNGFFTSFTGGIRFSVILALSGLPLLLLIHFFLPGIWCSKLCPMGGLQNMVNDTKNFFLNLAGRKENVYRAFLAGRKYFITAGAGLTAGLLIPRHLKPEAEPFFRPPASVSNDLFNTLCVRCGNCNKSCPTGIIVHRINPSDLLSFMTPEVRFESGYCLEECNLCSKVCSTGSITLFSPEAKREIIMGKAEIIISDCLLLKNIECNRCKASCCYQAIEFNFSDDLSKTIPVIDKVICVGCGACAVICPLRTIKIIPT